MKLYVVRHGETFGNAQGLIQGHLDDNLGQLNETGKIQAQKVGERFKDIHIDAIFTSPLRRAVDTAQEIIKFHPSLQLQFDTRLRERYWGALEGKVTPKDIDWENPPKDVETRKQAQIRAISFLSDIYKSYKDKTVVIVCHGGIKNVLLKHVLNRPLDAILEKPIKNTSVSFIEFENSKKHQVHVLCCVNHLEED